MDILEERLNFVSQLQVLLTNITKEDCQLLVDAYGRENDFIGMVQAIYEEIDAEKCQSIQELVVRIKQNSCWSDIQGRQEVTPGNDGSLEIPKSLVTASEIQRDPQSLHNQLHPSSPQTQAPSCSTFIPPQSKTGTRNHIRFRRNPKGLNETSVGQFLSFYLQDNNLRCLMYNIYENKSGKLLILMRGASGSGKSSLASTLWGLSETAEICSADHYFVSRSGEYNFNPRELGEAHASCRNRARSAFERGASPIIIDNTNIRVWEMEQYVELGVNYNYLIQILEPPTQWKTKSGQLSKKSIHGLSRKKIEEQLSAFEKTTVEEMIESYKRKLRNQNKNLNYQPNLDLDWGSNLSTSRDEWLLPTVTTEPFFANPPVSPATAPETSHTVSRSKPSKLSGLQTLSHLNWGDPPQVPSGPGTTLHDFVSPKLNNDSGSDPSARKRTRSAERRRRGNGAPKNEPAGAHAQRVLKPLQFEDSANHAFQTLCQLFPEAGKDQLETIFSKHNGDLDVCASVLMEDGFELANTPDETLNVETLMDHDQKDKRAVASATASSYTANITSGGDVLAFGQSSLYNAFAATPTPAMLSSTLESPTSSNVEANDSESRTQLGMASGSGSEASNVSADESEPSFQMVLPINFARNLLRVFGHPADESGPLSEAELKVKLDPSTAFELFKSLYNNLATTEPEPGTNAGHPDDSSRLGSPEAGYDEEELNQIAISLCQMELETVSGNPNLASIIDIESNLVKQKHSQDALRQYTSPFRTMAQNIAFSMLKQRFPHLDPAIVDEVYCECRLNVREATAALLEIAPQSDSEFQGSGLATGGQTWSLKYNPKDIQLYSKEELAEMMRTYEDMENSRNEVAKKIKERYDLCQVTNDPQVRMHYLREARKLHNKLDALSDEIQYYKAVKQNSKHKNDQILDMHGLQSKGGMRILKEFLQFKVQEFATLGIPKMHLLIITGKGNHSRSGPVILPQVRNFLVQAKYNFYVSKPGSFTVVLTRSSKLFRDLA